MAMQRTGTNPVKVEAEPQTLLRLRRMGRELRMTDQILSLDLDSVTIVEGGPAPAWTSPDGSVITIDVKRMPFLRSRESVAIWLGTNAHELFHNLYTPRDTTRLMRRITAAEHAQYTGIYAAWNILEDQRIERLGIARYAAWRGYLVAALSHHIPYDHDESWPLLAGRTWLPAEVRAISRARFVATNGGEHVANMAESLIGAYQRLTDPGETEADEAWDIVEQFWDAFSDKLPTRGACGTKPIKEGDPQPGDDHDGRYYPTADEPDEDEPEDDDDDELEADGDESDDDESDDESDDDGDDGDDDGDDGEGGDTDTDDDGSDESDDDGEDSDGDGDNDGDGESDDDTDGESDDASGEADGGGVSKHGDGSLHEAMREAVWEALSDDETKSDLDRVVDQVDHGRPGSGDLPRKTGSYVDVTDTARSLVRGVSDVLVQIKDDNEAAWIRRTDTGRFNVGRWATDPDWDADNIFDEFKAGAMDASSLDCVLVLDVSGSMSSQNFALSEATWAIRQAVDRVEGTCTVFGFGDGASMMFDQYQRPDGRLFLPDLESSTNPTPAVREAHRVVADSVAANKLVIILTDGQWYDGLTVTQAIAGCQAENATVAIIGLGGGASSVVPGLCGADVCARIFKSADLVPIFKDLAERSMLATARR